MTRNAINSTNPIGISSGGTNTSSMATQYGVAYYDGTKIATTGAGTAGQVFLSGAGAAAPAFGAASGGTGGAWTLIGTQNVSASAAITYSNLTSSYNVYMLNFTLSKSVAANSIYAQTSTNNGSSYATSGYLGGTWYMYYPSTTDISGSTASYFIMARGTGSSSGTAYFSGLGWGTQPLFLADSLTMTTTTNSPFWCFGASMQTTTAAYNAFKIYMSSGTLTGTVSLYGLSK